MKYEIRIVNHTSAIKTVEAKSAYDAMKKISGNMDTIAKCPKLSAIYGAPVFSKGKEGHTFRQEYTVTEVAEVTAEVTAEVVEVTAEVTAEVVTTETVEVSIEETATATMMTYTDAQLMDIVATHSLRNSKVDRILTEAATRELAGR